MSCFLNFFFSCRLTFICSSSVCACVNPCYPCFLVLVLSLSISLFSYFFFSLPLSLSPPFSCSPFSPFLSLSLSLLFLPRILSLSLFLFLFLSAAGLTDFLVLRDRFEKSLLIGMRAGMKIQSMFDDDWYYGHIISVKDTLAPGPGGKEKVAGKEGETEGAVAAAGETTGVKMDVDEGNGVSESLLAPGSTIATTTNSAAPAAAHDADTKSGVCAVPALSFAISPWRAVEVEWEEGEDDEKVEPVSAWEIEPVGSTTTVYYTPSFTVHQQQRYIQGLDAVMKLPLAQPFVEEVDFDKYPDYYQLVSSETVNRKEKRALCLFI